MFKENVDAFHGPDSSCSTIFEEHCWALCESVAHGGSTTIVADGNHYSDKWNLVFGSGADKGLAALCVEALQECIRDRELADTGDSQISIAMSCSSLHGDELADYFPRKSAAVKNSKDVQKVRISMDKNKFPFVAGLCEFREDGIADALAALRQRRRPLDPSAHMVLTLAVRQGKPSQQRPTVAGNVSRVNIVLLGDRQAGSQWDTILQIVLQMIEQKRPSIPFHKSKLALILKDGLLGRTDGMWFLNVSPVADRVEDVHRALRVAHRVRNGTPSFVRRAAPRVQAAPTSSVACVPQNTLGSSLMSRNAAVQETDRAIIDLLESGILNASSLPTPFRERYLAMNNGDLSAAARAEGSTSHALHSRGPDYRTILESGEQHTSDVWETHESERVSTEPYRGTHFGSSMSNNASQVPQFFSSIPERSHAHRPSVRVERLDVYQEDGQSTPVSIEHPLSDEDDDVPEHVPQRKMRFPPKAADARAIERAPPAREKEPKNRIVNIVEPVPKAKSPTKRPEERQGPQQKARKNEPLLSRRDVPPPVSTMTTRPTRQQPPQRDGKPRNTPSAAPVPRRAAAALSRSFDGTAGPSARVVDVLQAKVESLTTELTETKVRMQALERERKQYSGMVKPSKMSATLAKYREKHSDELENLTVELQLAREERDETLKKAKELAAVNASLKKECEERKAAGEEVSALKGVVSKRDEELLVCKKTIGSLIADISKFKEMVLEDQDRRRRVSDESAARAAMHTQLEQRLKALEEENSMLRGRVGSFEHQEMTIRDKLRAVRLEGQDRTLVDLIDTAVDDISTLSATLQQLTAANDSLGEVIGNIADR